MRVIRTFILRLLIDAKEPYACRGTIQALTDDEKYPFVGEAALLSLVSRLAQPDGAGPPCEETRELSE